VKLWLLRPVKNHALWASWYDKAFGFVVRAETEVDARALVSRIEHEEELEEGVVIRRAVPAYAGNEGVRAWSDSQYSTCVELNPEGNEHGKVTEVILRDFRFA